VLVARNTARQRQNRKTLNKQKQKRIKSEKAGHSQTLLFLLPKSYWIVRLSCIVISILYFATQHKRISRPTNTQPSVPSFRAWSGIPSVLHLSLAFRSSRTMVGSFYIDKGGNGRTCHVPRPWNFCHESVAFRWSFPCELPRAILTCQSTYFSLLKSSPKTPRRSKKPADLVLLPVCWAPAELASLPLRSNILVAPANCDRS